MAAALALPSFATGGESYLKKLTLILSSGTIEHAVLSCARPCVARGRNVAMVAETRAAT